jgi:hypothetical protein
MIIYQRDLNRKIGNLDEALLLLRNQFDPVKWEIEVVMHDKDRSPCMLAALLHNTDILLTPHGFQSMLLMFLPRTSILFEVSGFYLLHNEAVINICAGISVQVFQDRLCSIWHRVWCEYYSNLAFSH